MPKFALLLIVCLLLCSCSHGQEKTFEAETESAAISETADEISSESSAETNETHTMAITEIIDEENKPEEICTIVEDGTSILNINALAENSSDKLIFLSGGEISYLSGDLILAAFKSDNGDYGLVVDISDGSVINRIPGMFYPFYRGERLLCKLKNEDGFIYDIHNDGTYELTEYTDDNSIPIVCGSHRIVSDDIGNIIDSESGAVIVPAYINYDENGMPSIEGKHDIRYSVIAAVDSDRFLYQGFGYEWSTGFSVYDFKTGSSVDIPDSADAVDMGIVDGNIYFFKDEYNGDGRSLYRYNLNANETVLITRFEEMGRITAEYVLPENGEYIGVKIYDYYESHHSYVVIERDRGEILFTLPDTVGEGKLFFTDSFVCVRDYYKIYMISRDEIFGNEDT